MSALALAGLVAGCATAQATPTTEDVRRARALVTEIGRLVDQNQTAQWRLIDACMTAQGFPAHTGGDQIGNGSTLPDPLGSSPDLTAARQRGYGDDRPEQAARPEPLAAQPPEYRARYVKAQTGAEVGPDGRAAPTGPPAGCVGRARAVLYGEGGKPPPGVLLDIGDAAAKAHARDQGVVSILHRWSDCMTAAGHPGLDSPRAAQVRAAQLRQATPSAPPGPPVQAEIDLATADADCADRTGSRAVLARSWDTRLGVALVHAEPALIANRDQLRAALSRAENALPKE